MSKDYYIRTLKLKFYPFGDNKKEVRSRVYQISDDAWKAANWIATSQFINEHFIRHIYSRRKIDTKDKDAVSAIEEEFFTKTGFFGSKRQATSDRDHRPHFPNLPSCVSNSLNQVVFSSFNKEKGDVLMGKKSLRSYRQGMPFTTSQNSVQFFEDDGKHVIKWKLSRDEHLCFYIYYGKDKGNYKATMQKILDNEIKYSAPQIQVKKGDFYLLLPVQDEKKKFELNSELSVGVDLGVAVPAYVALSKGKPRLAIGSYDDFVRIRLQLQRRRRNLQRSLKQTFGGHGRKKKLGAMNRLSEKERNFAKSYNHMVSRNVVDFAIKNRAGVIKLELLEGFGKEESQAFVLRNWSFFELQTMIKYKADRAGIEVVYIDPYHTSQTCSECGHFEHEQRNKRNFKCAKCGVDLNADHNAAVNIARSEKVVTKKEQCEFYKKAA